MQFNVSKYIINEEKVVKSAVRYPKLAYITKKKCKNGAVTHPTLSHIATKKQKSDLTRPAVTHIGRRCKRML